jgi:hypothetical protein
MTYIVMPVKADENKDSQELLQDMRSFGKINEHVQKVGTVKEDCLSCIDEKTSIKKIALDNSTVDLGSPLFAADDVPYVIYLKRTSSSPAKIDLKFKNSYRYCEKTLISGMGTGCLLYLYKDIDEELSLNLKNLPKLKAGVEEMIELKLTKSNVDNPKYALEVKNLSNSAARGSVDSKFFSDGFNVDFKMAGE